MGRILDCCWSDFGCYLSDSGLLIVGLWVVILLIDGLWVVIGRILGCYWADSGLLFVRFWVVIGWIMCSYWSDS